MDGTGGISPSAQTAPSSKYSFFQMGTVRLSVSMPNRQASKAARRCAELTPMKTLVSPISIRPEPVYQRDPIYRKLGSHLAAEFAHFGQSHRLVGLVIEIQRAAAL